jgi:hypothetical protein
MNLKLTRKLKIQNLKPNSRKKPQLLMSRSKSRVRIKGPKASRKLKIRHKIKRPKVRRNLRNQEIAMSTKVLRQEMRIMVRVMKSLILIRRVPRVRSLRRRQQLQRKRFKRRDLYLKLAHRRRKERGRRAMMKMRKLLRRIAKRKLQLRLMMKVKVEHEDHQGLRINKIRR